MGANPASEGVSGLTWFETPFVSGLVKLEINIADDLYRRAVEIAAEEKISIDEIFISAFEARLTEFDRLQERARRGSHENFCES